MQYNTVQKESLTCSSDHSSPCSSFQTKTVLETRACWDPPPPVLWAPIRFPQLHKLLHGASSLDRRASKRVLNERVLKYCLTQTIHCTDGRTEAQTGAESSRCCRDIQPSGNRVSLPRFQPELHQLLRCHAG